MAVFMRVSAVLSRIKFGYGLTRNFAAKLPTSHTRTVKGQRGNQNIEYDFETSKSL
jgi:hypothetical protein